MQSPSKSIKAVEWGTVRRLFSIGFWMHSESGESASLVGRTTSAVSKLVV